MDTAASDGGGGGGGGATPLQTPRQQLGGQPYMQLAMYLAGNALTVIVGLLIWNLNSVGMQLCSVLRFLCWRPAATVARAWTATSLSLNYNSLHHPHRPAPPTPP
jgi:hypothetical protein